VWRSYPDPPDVEMQGHRIIMPSTTAKCRRELDVRAAEGAHHASSERRGSAAPVAGRSLKAQLKGRVETVATLKGIRLSRLSKHAQAELRGALE
jgi:hypothetical protein